HGDRPFAFRPDYPYLCPQSHEGRGRIRGMGDDADPVMPEYCMKQVLPVQGVTVVPTFPETIEFSTIIPAAGLLTEVPADGPLVSKLGAGNFRGALGKPRIFSPDQRTFRNFRDRGHR